VSKDATLRFDRFEVDPALGTITESGTPLRLQPQPFKLLVYLATRSGRLVTRSEIQQHLWGKDTYVDFESSLNFCISQIRSTLADDADSPRFIQTYPKRGYRFIFPLEIAEGDAASDLVKPEGGRYNAVATTWIAGPQKTVFAILLAALGLFALVAVATTWRFRVPPSATSSGTVTRIVVLPFKDLTPENHEEYLSEGFTDEVISKLSELRPDRVQVIARTTSMTYKQTSKSVGQIGSELHVDYVVESSIRRSANFIRVTSRLVHVSDQAVHWSQDYDIAPDRLFEIGRPIATAIAKETGIVPQNPATITHAVSSAQAYDAYLKGLYEWHQWTPEGWKRSCEYFRQATEDDPSYAAAYAALANCYRALVGYNALPAKEGYAKAKEAAQKAVLLDPNSVDAHTALGSNFLAIDWSWPAAHAEFDQALQLNPNHAEAHRAYGTFLRYMGDFDGAIREGKRSEELDPLSNIARLALCATYTSASKLDQAVDECNRSIQLQPNSEGAYILLSQIFARQHRYDDSAVVTVKALRLEGANMLADKFMATYHKLGYTRAEALLAEEMKELYRDPKAYENQLLFMQLDKKDSAIRFLQAAFDAHDSLLVTIKSDPTLAFLHGDPRFEALLSKMHFDTY
jgi:TolB-like protein/DNA-binding winged helix-turn-helix (wHTH) protein/Tfp pilus assembly protein PilF